MNMRKNLKAMINAGAGERIVQKRVEESEFVLLLLLPEIFRLGKLGLGLESGAVFYQILNDFLLEAAKVRIGAGTQSEHEDIPCL
jgi:hypothetical protein